MKPKENQDAVATLLRGGGEMGELTRKKDWSKTIISSPENWPQSLRTTLNILLNSKFPMFLWWGKELICFYNDAYRSSLGVNGKHPDILGMPAKEAWTEIWDTIKPLIDTVLNGEGATWSQNQLIPIYRNGKIEDVYWTFSYSPVYGESATPEGVLVTCYETTKEVNAFQQVNESRNELTFAIAAAELATWDFDPVTGKLSCNDRAKEWFNLPSDFNNDLNLGLERIIEEDRSKVVKLILQALSGYNGGVCEMEYTIAESGLSNQRHLHARGKVFFNDKGIAYRFSGIIQDITEKVEASKKIKATERDFRELANSLPALVWTTDENGKQLFVSKKWGESTGIYPTVNQRVAGSSPAGGAKNQLFTRVAFRGPLNLPVICQWHISQ